MREWGCDAATGGVPSGGGGGVLDELGMPQIVTAADFLLRLRAFGSENK